MEVRPFGSATCGFIMATSCRLCAHINRTNPSPSLLLYPPSPSLTMRAVSSDTAFSPETLESIHKTHENSVPEIPPHWIFEREGYPSNHTDFCWWPISHFLHHAFCAIGFGHTSLPDVWKVCHPDCLPEVWERERETTRDRLQHVNIVVRTQRS